MKKLLAVLAILMLSVVAVACGPTEQEDGPKTITLSYSGTASDKTFNMGLFEDFKAARKAAGDENTYVINYLEIGPDKIDSTIQDWTSPNAPDVYEAASDKINILYGKGALSKLGQAAQNYIDDEMSSLGKQLSTFNGEYYTYPYTGDNTYYLQYDKSVFSEEEVKTIEGLLAAAQTKGVKVAYDLKTAFWGGAAMFTFGADYSVTYDEDGVLIDCTADFNGAKGLKAAKAIHTIMNHPNWVSSAGVPAAPSEGDGEAEVTAAVIGGTWDISGFKKLWGDNYGCAVMPTVTVEGETAHLGVFLGGKFFGVNPQRSKGNEARYVAAHQLAQFLSGAQCQTKRYEEFGIYPCNVNAQNHPAMADDQNILVLKAQSEFAHAQTAVPAEFWTAPATLTAGIEDGTITLEGLQAAIEIFNNAVTGKKATE